MQTALSTRDPKGLASRFLRDPMTSFRQEMNQLLGRFADDFDGGWMGDVQVLSMNLAETPDNVEVTMDVPGLKAEEINVEVRGQTLVVSGQHKEEQEEKGKTFHRIERRSGSILRTIALPCDVQEGDVSAESANGVLRVILPKAVNARTRKIPVKG